MVENRWVYILKGDRYYIGSTNNIERRLEEHMSWNTYTTKRIWIYTLVRRIPCISKEEARKLERKIKKWWHYERRDKTLTGW